VPGYISKTIYSDTIQPGWNWLPYNAKKTVLLAEGQGVDGSTATCATLSEGGAVEFRCRQGSRPGYQPFAGAESLQFDIRSNTKSDDPFASSTPARELPGLKIFLMNVSGFESVQ
jgi:cullin-associated NEDD8-dissociated protein 1